MSATNTTTTTKVPVRATKAAAKPAAPAAIVAAAKVVPTQVPNATKQGPYLTFVEFHRQKGTIKAAKADGSWSREVALLWKQKSVEQKQAWWLENREDVWPDVDFSVKPTKSTRSPSAYTFFQKAHTGLGLQPGDMSALYKALTPESKAPYDELAKRAKAGETISPQDITAAKLQSDTEAQSAIIA
jgi:hypothetical protein